MNYEAYVMRKLEEYYDLTVKCEHCDSQGSSEQLDYNEDDMHYYCPCCGNVMPD